MRASAATVAEKCERARGKRAEAERMRASAATVAEKCERARGKRAGAERMRASAALGRAAEYRK